MANDSLTHLGDLEIYIECNDLDALVNWLKGSMTGFEEVRRSKRGCKFRCGSEKASQNGMIVLNAGRTGYSSVWIDGKDTPWQDDIAMGRSAFTTLNATVRCVESAWSKGDDPDQWLQISKDGEQIIQWITEES